jgi:hypothetical protein
VLGQSLLVKLRGHAPLAGRVMQHLLGGMDPAAAFYSPVRSAGGHTSPLQGGAGGSRGSGGTAAGADERGQEVQSDESATNGTSSSSSAVGQASIPNQPPQQQGWGGGSATAALTSSGSRSWVHLPCAQVLPEERQSLLAQVAGCESYNSATTSGSSASIPGLGVPLQKEWVLLAGQPPGVVGGGSGPPKHASGAPLAAAAGAGGAGGTGMGAGAAAGGSSEAGTVPPPSRLYLQEAAGEMRLAVVLVSEQGL